MVAFWKFVQKVFERNLNLMYRWVKIPKKYNHQVVNFQNWYSKVPLLFRISYCLVPKIEICIKYFSDNNFKSNHCGWSVLELQKKAPLDGANFGFLTCHFKICVMNRVAGVKSVSTGSSLMFPQWQKCPNFV